MLRARFLLPLLPKMIVWIRVCLWYTQLSTYIDLYFCLIFWLSVFIKIEGLSLLFFWVSLYAR